MTTNSEKSTWKSSGFISSLVQNRLVTQQCILPPDVSRFSWSTLKPRGLTRRRSWLFEAFPLTPQLQNFTRSWQHHENIQSQHGLHASSYYKRRSTFAIRRGVRLTVSEFTWWPKRAGGLGAEGVRHALGRALCCPFSGQRTRVHRSFPPRVEMSHIINVDSLQTFRRSSNSPVPLPTKEQ